MHLTSAFCVLNEDDICSEYASEDPTCQISDSYKKHPLLIAYMCVLIA